MSPELTTVAMVTFPLFVGIAGWLGKRQVERLERDLQDEREAREKDRHDVREAMNGLGVRLADLRDKVLSECINHEGMAQAMRPVMDRLGEIRADIKEIYGRLERKADKPGGD